jgi:hypothetical protein
VNSSRLTQQLDISSEIVHQILSLLLKITSYKTKILEVLTDRNKGGAVEFLSRDSDCVEAYHNILSKIWFIDESHHFLYEWNLLTNGIFQSDEEKSTYL